MIRLRTAFFIILLGCAAAFCIGVEIGYLAARNNDVAVGLKEWVDNMILTGKLTTAPDKQLK